MVTHLESKAIVLKTELHREGKAGWALEFCTATQLLKQLSSPAQIGLAWAVLRGFGFYFSSPSWPPILLQQEGTPSNSIQNISKAWHSALVFGIISWGFLRWCVLEGRSGLKLTPWLIRSVSVAS